MGQPHIAVTPPAFCRSQVLRQELTACFPGARFNERDRYLTGGELVDFLRGARGAIVGRDPVDEDVLSGLSELEIIAKYGVGLDNLDEAALQRHGVRLGWTQGVNRLSVAELTLGFMVGLCHNVFVTGPALKRNVWEKDGGRQLSGRTVGIVGCGHVGSEVVRLLAPFQCRVLVRDILDKSEFCKEHGAEPVGFDDLIARSDLVSLHVPLTEATQGMIDRTVMGRMRDGAFLINTSRGGVVREDDLKAALKAGNIAGAALDVFAEEPPEDAELLGLPNLMATPHIGGNTVEAVEAMGRSAIAHLVEHFQT